MALLQSKRLGVIGAGAMGGALCRGIISSGTCLAKNTLVCELNGELREQIARELGVNITDSCIETVLHSDVILLAVKPHIVPHTLKDIGGLLKPEQLLISIAAGIPLSTYEASINEKTPVIRAMPNTPALVRCGATAFCPGSYASDEHLSIAREIFSAVGIAVLVEERMMNAVTGLSGSGPAYVYLIIEALTAGGVLSGIPRDLAHQLAAQTVLGSAKMALDTGIHPAILKDQVTTPAGTTIAGLAELERNGVRAAFIDAVQAAAQRSEELGK